MKLKKLDEERIRDWERQKKEFDAWLEKVRREICKDCVSMINWLLFYKPKGKVDKILHIIEVVLVWVLIQLAYAGLRWG